MKKLGGRKEGKKKIDFESPVNQKTFDFERLVNHEGYIMAVRKTTERNKLVKPYKPLQSQGPVKKWPTVVAILTLYCLPRAFKGKG